MLKLELKKLQEENAALREATNNSGYYWLPEPDYRKAVGQLRLQILAALSYSDIYGLGIFIPGATDEIVEVCEQFSKRTRGADVPIRAKKRRNHR